MVVAEIYKHAKSRIEPAGKQRWVPVVFWTVLAIFLGLMVTGFDAILVSYIVFHGAFWAIILLTPPLVGQWVLKVHNVPGADDESLRALPVTAKQIINPRMKAVFHAWFRFFSPLAVLMVLAHESVFTVLNYDTFTRVYLSALTLLVKFPYLKPMSVATMFNREFDFLMGIIPSNDPYLITGRILVILLGLLLCVGWVILPVTWGFFQRTSTTSVNRFWTRYFSYLILPVTLAAFNYASRSMLRTLFNIKMHDIPSVPWVSVMGLSGLLLSIIVYLITLNLWGRKKA